MLPTPPALAMHMGCWFLTYRSFLAALSHITYASCPGERALLRGQLTLYHTALLHP